MLQCKQKAVLGKCAGLFKLISVEFVELLGVIDNVLSSLLHGFSSSSLITNLFQNKSLPPASDHQGD